MTEKQPTHPLCQNVFKSAENKISPQQFTEKWITLINRIEKNKTITTQVK